LGRPRSLGGAKDGGPPRGGHYREPARAATRRWPAGAGGGAGIAGETPGGICDGTSHSVSYVTSATLQPNVRVLPDGFCLGENARNGRNVCSVQCVENSADRAPRIRPRPTTFHELPHPYIDTWPSLKPDGAAVLRR